MAFLEKTHTLSSFVFGLILAFVGVVVIFSEATLIVVLLALALLISGVLSAAAAIHFPSGRIRNVALIKSVVSIAVALIAIAKRESALQVFMYLMGAQFLVSGVLDLIGAVSVRKNYGVGGLTGNGVASILLSLLLFLFPQGVGNAVLMVIGVLFLLFGLAMVVWAVRIHKVEKQVESTADATILSEEDVE